MEEQEKKTAKCYQCFYFDRYFTKELTRYVRTKIGFCSTHKKSVNAHDCCECWKLKKSRYLYRQRAAEKILNEILLNISAIRQIYQDNLYEVEYEEYPTLP